MHESIDTEEYLARQEKLRQRFCTTHQKNEITTACTRCDALACFDCSFNKLNKCRDGKWVSKGGRGRAVEVWKGNKNESKHVWV